MEEIKTLKLVNSENNDDFQVEFEVISPSKNNVFEAEIEEIDNELENIDSYIQELQNEVDRLTNKADKVDYIVAGNYKYMLGATARLTIQNRRI